MLRQIANLRLEMHAIKYAPTIIVKKVRYYDTTSIPESQS